MYCRSCKKLGYITACEPRVSVGLFFKYLVQGFRVVNKLCKIAALIFMVYLIPIYKELYVSKTTESELLEFHAQVSIRNWYICNWY